MSSTAAIARDLLAVVLAGVEPTPDADALVALRATLRRQVAAAGPAAALGAVERLSAAPGPACIDTRRARFAGYAAVLASARPFATVQVPGIEPRRERIAR